MMESSLFFLISLLNISLLVPFLSLITYEEEEEELVILVVPHATEGM